MIPALDPAFEMCKSQFLNYSTNQISKANWFFHIYLIALKFFREKKI